MATSTMASHATYGLVSSVLLLLTVMLGLLNLNISLLNRRVSKFKYHTNTLLIPLPSITPELEFQGLQVLLGSAFGGSSGHVCMRLNQLGLLEKFLYLQVMISSVYPIIG